MSLLHMLTIVTYIKVILLFLIVIEISCYVSVIFIGRFSFLSVIFIGRLSSGCRAGIGTILTSGFSSFQSHKQAIWTVKHFRTNRANSLPAQGLLPAEKVRKLNLSRLDLSSFFHLSGLNVGGADETPCVPLISYITYHPRGI